MIVTPPFPGSNTLHMLYSGRSVSMLEMNMLLVEGVYDTYMLLFLTCIRI